MIRTVASVALLERLSVEVSIALLKNKGPLREGIIIPMSDYGMTLTSGCCLSFKS